MEMKEMPIEEKYDKLLNEYLLDAATHYAIHKELGAVDKFLDLYIKVQKKMTPSVIGIALKVLKAVTPGKAFKQVTDQFLYWGQTFHPLATLEETKVSDREAVIRIKNCVLLKRARDLVKKAGLDIDPKFFCEIDAKYLPGVLKEFGVDVAWELEENGCRATAKLK